MPGVRSRRAPSTRLTSAVTRGAPSPAGSLGTSAVVRRPGDSPALPAEAGAVSVLIRSAVTIAQSSFGEHSPVAVDDFEDYATGSGISYTTGGIFNVAATGLYRIFLTCTLPTGFIGSLSNRALMRFDASDVCTENDGGLVVASWASGAGVNHDVRVDRVVYAENPGELFAELVYINDTGGVGSSALPFAQVGVAGPF